MASVGIEPITDKIKFEHIYLVAAPGSNSRHQFLFNFHINSKKCTSLKDLIKDTQRKVRKIRNGKKKKKHPAGF